MRERGEIEARVKKQAPLALFPPRPPPYTGLYSCGCSSRQESDLLQRAHGSRAVVDGHYEPGVCFGVQDLCSRIQGSGFRVEGVGFKVQG